MTLQQTIDTESLASHQKEAQHDYPNDDPDFALSKYIAKNKLSDLYFLNEAGERCLWGPGQYHLGILLVYCLKLTCLDIQYQKYRSLGGRYYEVG